MVLEASGVKDIFVMQKEKCIHLSPGLTTKLLCL